MSATTAPAPKQAAVTARPAFVGPLARRIALAYVEAAGTVQGFCVDASVILCHALRHEGYNARVVYGLYGEDEHAWVEVDGWVLDPTREQFTGGVPARLLLDSCEAQALYREGGWRRSGPEQPDAQDAAVSFRTTLGGHDAPGTFCGELAGLLTRMGCDLS